MYTPITKRVKVAQHKSSVAKQMANQTTETAITADAQGNKTITTGTGNEGTYIPPEKYEGPDACKDPNSAKCKEWNLKTKDANRTLMRKVVVVLKNLRWHKHAWKC
jgi:leucyl aminopeptidase (aminopeptidase T)